MREGLHIPMDWLKQGEKWPGQRDDLPEPGTEASDEFERQVYRQQFGKERPPHLNPRRPSTS